MKWWLRAELNRRHIDMLARDCKWQIIIVACRGFLYSWAHQGTFMASIYKRGHSPVWWIKFKNPTTGKTCRESTRFLRASKDQTRAAQSRAAAETSRELSAPASAFKSEEMWRNWVGTFLDIRYGQSPKTRLRAANAWRNLELFLSDRAVERPRQLTRDDCFSYPAWRKTPDKRKRKYNATHNTAHTELIFLSVLMQEAVIRGYTPANIVRGLGIKREPPKQRPELPQVALDEIAEGIERETEPLRTALRHSFLIARWMGRRISETYVNPMTDVALDNLGQSYIITFRIKGGKTVAKNLHPRLVPLFEELRARKATESYPLIKSFPKRWHLFLKKIGIPAHYPNACFHSLRVTAATRMARADVSEKKAMSYLDHASTTVHRSYVRLRPDDLAECEAALE